MKPIFTSLLAGLVTVTLTGIAVRHPVHGANTFEEQAIAQDKIIAVARPYGQNKYDLLVIEQIPGKNQCWSESGSNPTTIEPLLLKFDFTGHCSRSTDSNGYSIRIAGQDYGLDYLLRVVQRNGELFLVGTPRTNASKQEIIVGRTYGMKPGFIKFILNRGWNFSKRAYQGKVLGHVYFSGDRTALNSTDDSTTVAVLPTTNSDRASVSDSPNTNSRPHTNLNNTSTSSNTRNREITFTAGNSNSASTSRRLPSSLSSPRVSTSPTSRRLPSVLSSPLPASSPSSLTSRRLPSSLLSPRVSPGSSTLPPPPPIPSGKTPQTTSAEDSELTPPPTNNSQMVPQPTSNAQSNSQKTLSDVIAVTPRPLPGTSSTTAASSNVSTTSQNYRVLIQASDSSQQDKLRSRYPDAFRTIYQGRSMWQIGVFGNWNNADKALQSVKGLGLDGMILE